MAAACAVRGGCPHAHRWAAFLGTATEVHYPLVGEWWGPRPRHRWWPDEPRFVFHDLQDHKYFLDHDSITPEIAKKLNYL